MILYTSPTSPYARKVEVLLRETHQLDAVERIASSTAPTNPRAGIAAKNPLMKIPALERPDGCTLYDSRVICQYLDDRAGAGLYPEGVRRWETMTLEATADGILDAALLMVYETRLRDEDQRFEGWVEAQWSKIASACDALNTRWVSHLNGKLDMGQIAVGCAMGYLDFRLDARKWRQGRDALAGWYAGFSERSSMQDTIPRD